MHVLKKFFIQKNHFFESSAFFNDWPQNPKKFFAQGDSPTQYLDEDMFEFFLG